MQSISYEVMVVPGGAPRDPGVAVAVPARDRKNLNEEPFFRVVDLGLTLRYGRDGEEVLLPSVAREAIAEFRRHPVALLVEVNHAHQPIRSAEASVEFLQ